MWKGVYMKQSSSFEEHTKNISRNYFNEAQFQSYDEALTDDTVPSLTLPYNEVTDHAGKTLSQQSFADKLIGTEVLLPSGEAESLVKVVCNCVGTDEKVKGSYDDNPILNTILYEIKFPDDTL